MLHQDGLFDEEGWGGSGFEEACERFGHALVQPAVEVEAGAEAEGGDCVEAVEGCG